MTDFENMSGMFDELSISYSKDWSMESDGKNTRVVNWIYMVIDDVEIDWKFNTYGRYEGVGCRIWD